MFDILGTGMYLPANLISNEVFYEKWGRDPYELVFERIGHGARYYASKEEDSASMGIEAAKRALVAANCRAEEIDLLITSTDTPSTLSPATGAEIQYKLGAVNAGVFDVNCACAGFVTAMDIASKFLDGNQYKKILVIGTYAMSKFLDPDDKVATPLFGDGAGAVVLAANPSMKQHYASKLIADGQYWDYMGIYAGGTKEPITHQGLEERRHTVKILKKYPPTLNQDEWPKLIEKTLASQSLTKNDVDVFIFTQIRKATIVDIMKKWELPMEKTHTIMEKWGYTGSACVPMALHDALQEKKIKKGNRVVLCASGGGYSMACISFIY